MLCFKVRIIPNTDVSITIATKQWAGYSTEWIRQHGKCFGYTETILGIVQYFNYPDHSTKNGSFVMEERSNRASDSKR